MLSIVLHWLTVLLIAFVTCGCLYALSATVVVKRFARRNVRAPSAFPSITLLKPLYGAEATLFDDLAAFCNQDYPGPVQIVIGVRDSDPAMPAVKRLIAE